MSSGFIIAIDGPVASGKGTIAKELAKRVQGMFLTTGMFYRAVTYYCLQNGIDIHDESLVQAALPKIQIQVDGETTVVNGKEVTDKLRRREVDTNVAVLSNYTGVRSYLIPIIHDLGIQKMQEGNIVIIEGRDMGTRVFPDAHIKLYLTATPQVRAKRRFQQQQALGIPMRDFEEVYQDTLQRDKLDMYGKLQYLTPEPKKYGYTVLDDSDLTEQETIEKILNIIDATATSRKSPNI